MKALFIFLTLFFSFQHLSIAQEWEKVILKELNEAEMDSLEQAGYEAIGESFIETTKTIKSLDDLTESESKKIKKDAAEYGSYIVYVDVRHLFIKDKLYYVWFAKYPEE